jgi:hypothetical protein
MHVTFQSENLKEKGFWEEPGVGERTILYQIIKKLGEQRTDLFDPGYDQMMISCECGHKTFSSINGVEFTV